MRQKCKKCNFKRNIERCNFYKENKVELYKSKIEKKYGITIDDYEKLRLQQNDSCAICGLTEEENGKLLAIDHNHKTKKVRELLCSGCNLIVGALKEDANLCLKIKFYIEKHEGEFTWAI